ncbi:MAG: hypothetical protein M3Y18_03340 [Candidatus Eremiobacteraeota bacterium]|nr:hypothetical protein [Candidatus Eremiobacteraeota bacterium]
MIDAPAAPKANGLTTVVNTIVAPQEAFETLRLVPMWGWAFIITFALFALGTLLEAPTTQHVNYIQTQHMVATSSLFANMTPAQKQQALARAAHPGTTGSILPIVFGSIGVLLVALLNTVILLIGNAVGKGQANFKRLFCGSMNIAVPTFGLYTLVNAAIIAVRGPTSFNSMSDILHAVPGLGMFGPAGSVVTTGFLSGINIFTLWGLFLNATLLIVMARVAKPVAWTTAVVILFFGAAVSSSFIALAHSFGAV